jgi:hypothetical protein
MAVLERPQWGIQGRRLPKRRHGFPNVRRSIRTILKPIRRMNMENIIREKLVDYYRECSVDRYGQVGVIRAYDVFKDITDDVQEYAKENKSLISISTYGGSLGTFRGLQIMDSDLQSECRNELRNNENYINAMTNW